MSAGTTQGSQFGALLLWRVGVEDESQNESEVGCFCQREAQGRGTPVSVSSLQLCKSSHFIFLSFNPRVVSLRREGKSDNNQVSRDWQPQPILLEQGRLWQQYGHHPMLERSL